MAQVYKAYADLAAVTGAQAQEPAWRSELRSASEAWEVSGFRGLLRWLRKRKSEGRWEERGKEELGPVGCSPESPLSGARCVEQMAKPPPNTSPSPARHLTPVAIKVSCASDW